jgi:hypothetical protein
MENDFISHIQRRIAETSIAPSTLRGIGPEGTVEKARLYLRGIDLSDFRVRNKTTFIDVLDGQTLAMKSRLPKGGQYWGVARKSLNIFLREASYNRFLCDEYDLYRLEPWLEIPLDGRVAKGLRLEREGNELRRWKGVIHLEKRINQQYQNVAEKVAGRLGLYRIHLDLIYWRGIHTDDEK